MEPGFVIAVLVVLVAAAAAYERRRFPSTTCRRCRGTGKRRSWWDGKSWRACGYCSGGTATRWGSN